MPRAQSHHSAAAVAALLCLVALGCGGGAEGSAVTGPDAAGAHSAGSISVASGANQSAAPGQAVPIAPVLRATSERGRPLQGATLSLAPDGGRGTLDGTAIVTDANGEATLPRWIAPLSAGDFSVSVSAAGQGGTIVTTHVNASVADVSTPLTTETIGATGGSLVVAATAPLSGLQIAVPPGALTQATTFSVASGPAPTLPSEFTLASPLIGISAANTVSDSIITVRIPATGTAGTGMTLRAFVIAADNGLIPLPTISSDATSITVGLSDFTGPATASMQLQLPSATRVEPSVLPGFGIRILIAFWSLPTSGVFQTGFATGRDNLEFVNYGSFAASHGYCAGSTVLAGGWFRWKSGVAQLTARAEFPGLLTPAETGNWLFTDQLNPAIRLATALQRTYGPPENSIGSWKAMHLKQNDRAVWENVLFQVKYSAQPVFLVVYNATLTAGHAVLAYRVDASNGQIYVSDPNYPENAGRVVQWHAGTFSPFLAKANAGEADSTEYTRFADGTYLFWENRNGISATIDQYLQTGLVAQYPRAMGVVTLKSGQVVAVDALTNLISVQSRDDVLHLTVTNIGSGTVHVVNTANGVASDEHGLAVPSNNTDITIPLASGQNRIGLVLWKTLPVAPPPPALPASWWDTKLLVVTRAQPTLAFLTQPASAQENASLGAVRIGLVDEDGTPVPEVRSLDITLQGGTAGAVLSGGGTVTTGADGTVTVPALSVDRAGTGYTLLVSGNQLGAVSSAAFTISAGGTFTGHVMHAVTSAGLAGVSVVVHNATQSLATTTSASGDWTVSGLSPGTFQVDASKSGFVSTSVFGQVVTPPSTVVENIPLSPTATPGGIFGSIRNATTAALITSATLVEARAGMNATSGTVVASQLTSTGSYALANLPAGVYTLVAHNAAYSDGSHTGVVSGGGTAATGPDLVLNPLAGGAAARVVLSWGATPYDLDSHLTGPVAGSSNRFWVYWSSRGSCSAAPFACLDVDDTNGYGPETMTISQVATGVYRYYVYDFTNRNATSSTALGLSGAKVEFYVGSTLVRTFFVPGGTGNAWAVFEWNGSAVTVLNQLYTTSGVPQPAMIVGASPAADASAEIQQLAHQPAKRP